MDNEFSFKSARLTIAENGSAILRIPTTTGAQYREMEKSEYIFTEGKIVRHEDCHEISGQIRQWKFMGTFTDEDLVVTPEIRDKVLPKDIKTKTLKKKKYIFFGPITETTTDYVSGYTELKERKYISIFVSCITIVKAEECLN